MASVEREGDVLRPCTVSASFPPEELRFEPGLMSVKRWTMGIMAEPRIVDPPSVAAATDGAMMLDVAVWYDSIDSIDSDEVEVVGVGPCAPVASGCEVRSSEPLGFGDGRIVRIEESEGGIVSVVIGECPRMTVVL